MVAIKAMLMSNATSTMPLGASSIDSDPVSIDICQKTLHTQGLPIVREPARLCLQIGPLTSQHKDGIDDIAVETVRCILVAFIPRSLVASRVKRCGGNRDAMVDAILKVMLCQPRISRLAYELLVS
mmetsp:Transcript_108963/g.318920  ORF Transcript_108963/g.318920 Transcript_108963/m.318920 type:complete len:126 (-) Transcript_108963:775-1152(-)